MSNHLERGHAAEGLAAEYLQKKGFVVVARNYKGSGAEIDLILRHKSELHFVEVKARWSLATGHPLEQVTPKKQRRLARAAETYLLQHPLKPEETVYLSVLGIDHSGLKPEFHWVPDAFEGYSF